MLVLHIACKELLDLLREKKFLVKAAVWSILAGAAMGILSVIALSAMALERPPRTMELAVAGTQWAPPALLAELARAGFAVRPYADGVALAVRRGTPAIGLIFTRTSQPGEGNFQEVSATIMRSDSLLAGQDAMRLSRVLAEYNDSQLEAADRSALGAGQASRGFSFTTAELQTQRQRIGAASVLMALLALLALGYTAGVTQFVDAIYGEKERLTLEALLLAGNRDSLVLFGKLLRIFLVLAALLALCVLGFYLGHAVILGAPWGIGATVTAMQFMLLGLGLYAVMLALFVVAPTFATNARQAAFFCGFAGLAVISLAVPAGAGAMNLPVQTWGAVIPVAGAAAAIRALLLNGVLGAGPMIWFSLGTVAACAGFLFAVSRIFNRERLLYKS